MGSIKNQIAHNIVNPISKDYSTTTVVGIVTDIKESNNTCDVRYVDKYGVKRDRKDVVVRLYGSGTDWFPSVNDQVEIEEGSSTCVIVARHIGNFNMDVRSKMELKQDINSDGNGCIQPGGEIF